MPKVHIRTYGCQMNERDSEQVARMFTEGGYTVTGNEAEADAILVNTCSVRDQAEQKALGKMGSMGSYRRERPHVVYGFMGCMAQSRGAELFEWVPHLDVVVGTQKYHKVFEYVDAILQRRLERHLVDREHGDWFWRLNPDGKIDPAKPKEVDRAPLKELTIQPDGKTHDPLWIWSGETLMNLRKNEALAMRVQKINDTEFLFIQAGGFETKKGSTWTSPWFVMKRP